jgi:acyl carrier protein
MTASVVPQEPTDPRASRDSTDAALEAELAEIFVTALNLEQSAADIDPQMPLYEDGLGLDLRADDQNNAKIFASLRSLAQHIRANRTR